MSNSTSQFTESNFDGGFPGGVTIQGLPLVISPPGKVYWVDSLHGSDQYRGTFNRPFATISKAATVAGAGNAGTLNNQADYIIVKQGHVENVTAAAGINFAYANVVCIGMGDNTGRPTITLKTATTATVKVTAANVRIQGLKFIHGINSLATCIDVQAKGCVISNCEFNDGASTTGVQSIALTGSANTQDNLKILGCKFYHPTAGNMTAAIGLAVVNDNVEVAGNYIYGNFSLSGLHNITGKVLTNLNVHDNNIINLTAATQAMNLISACTGVCYRNVFLPGDTATFPATFGSLQVSGINLSNNGNMDVGEQFMIKKVGLVSSSITTTPASITSVSQGGILEIMDVIVQTDGTGLATGTNFQLGTTNAKGATVFFAETVANLGANKTVTLVNASVTKLNTVLENGKAIQVSSTGANCTGAGTIDIYFTLRRRDAGATLVNV